MFKTINFFLPQELNLYAPFIDSHGILQQTVGHVAFTHYPPWIDASTSNIPALWNCYFLPHCGQNTFVDNLLTFLVMKEKKLNFFQKINLLLCFMSQ